VETQNGECTEGSSDSKEKDRDEAMSERENTKETKKVHSTIYTGEGYVPKGARPVRRSRSIMKDNVVNHPKRRIEELREEDEKRQQAEEAARLEAEKKHQSEEKKRQAAEKKQQLETEKKHQAVEKKQQEAEKKHQSEEKKHQMSSREKPAAAPLFAGPVKWILRGAGAVLVVAYVAAAVYFSSHFYRGTSLYGIDCSQKTVDEVKAEVRDELSSYKLDIQEREDRTETVSASQIDLSYEDDGSIEQMMKNQRAYLWPVMTLLQKTQSGSVSFTYDRDEAETVIDNLQCMDSEHMVEPHDAYINPTDTGYEVADEVMGTTLDPDKTQNAILEALDAGAASISLEEADCYINPEKTQDDIELIQAAASMSELGAASITLEFGDQQEVINSAVIQQWITQMSNGQYVINDAKVTEYVESLADRYDTFGLPLDFNTSIGTTVTLSGGDYGWCMDQDATVRELLNAIEDGYRGEMEPVYLYTAMSHENQGIGYTYVEICISRQEMWCYQDGALVVDTPVVTGNPNKGNATPSGGVWAIDSKQRNATLTGEGYSAPVDYWIPFNGNVGIHDLQTRAYFGGTIYLTNGSHGCVNTPYAAVQQIYETVSVGTPVIVYD
jgi:hypothetical protein